MNHPLRIRPLASLALLWAPVLLASAPVLLALALVLLALAPVGARAADELSPRLKLSPAPMGLKAPRGAALPLFLSADRVVGDLENVVASGRVELRRLGLRVGADHLTYSARDDALEASGDVEFETDSARLRGDRLSYQPARQTGRFDNIDYRILPATGTAGQALRPAGQLALGAHGGASTMVLESENQYRLEDATFSTCEPGDDSWFLRVSDLELDYETETGYGYNTAVWFKGVPIFYSPWLTFPLNNRRRSGVLPPTFGSTSSSGIQLTVPYYLNLAPNMDATLSPTYLSKRGTQLDTEFRYLGRSYSGETRYDILPDDRLRQIDRWSYSVQHQQRFAYGLSAGLNVNGASDDNYYRDLSTRASSSAQTQLVRHGLLGWNSGAWSSSVQVTRYQTLQPDPDNLVERPYELMPQLNLDGWKPLAGDLTALLSAQYTDFSHPDEARIEARRAVLYPQLSWPVVRPWGYLTPKFGVHMTRYRFDGDAATAAGLPDTFDRTVPITTLDTGLVFERSARWFDTDLTQTLEPRLFYLYVPFRDQSLLTDRQVNFDSGISDFNFAQIFSENQFTGQDRIADANQLTAAVGSRFIDPVTGGERLAVTLGQRFYFTPQQVTLNPGDAPRTERKTDILGAMSGRLSDTLWLDGGMQYNLADRRMERSYVGTRWMPEAGHLLNASYRLVREQEAPFAVAVEQIDLSGQWPLFGGWQGVGRYNYSVDERSPIEVIAGLEYRAACWAARAVVQRYSTTANENVRAIFFQIELSNFSQIGSNPLGLLRRSVPGYVQAGDSGADPVFGNP